MSLLYKQIKCFAFFIIMWHSTIKLITITKQRLMRQETRNRLFQVRGIVKCLTSWRKTVIKICCDSNDVVAMRRNMFGCDAVASYFRWHMGISVLSTDVKLIVRTVGITSTASSLSLYSSNNIRIRYVSVSNSLRMSH